MTFGIYCCVADTSQFADLLLKKHFQILHIAASCNGMASFLYQHDPSEKGCWNIHWGKVLYWNLMILYSCLPVEDDFTLKDSHGFQTVTVSSEHVYFIVSLGNDKPEFSKAVFFFFWERSIESAELYLLRCGISVLLSTSVSHILAHLFCFVLSVLLRNHFCLQHYPFMKQDTFLSTYCCCIENILMFNYKTSTTVTPHYMAGL